MLAVFFDSRGVVHHEYAPQGQTITKEYYQNTHFNSKRKLFNFAHAVHL
jgi:hypothetical protein